MVYLAYGMVWVSTAAGVCCAIYYTHSSLSLLAFIIPACLSLTTKK